MRHLGRVGGLVLSWGFVIVVVGPVAWVLFSSFKSNAAILDSPWRGTWPPEFGNYAKAWVGEDLGSGFLLSLVVTAGSLAVLLPVGALSAYALARFRFRGSGAVFGVISAGLLFPNLLAAVPLYLMMSGWGLDDTVPGLVMAYVAYSLSFTVFVLHGFFSGLPDELGEAAEMDGCSPMGVFLRVMVPLARPGLVVVGIFNAIGLWNEYNLAKVLLLREKTLPVGLSDLISQQQYAGEWGALFAGTTIVMGPILVVYWFMRERIQEAMLAGAIK